MLFVRLLGTALLALLLASSTSAGEAERPDHFKGKPAKNLEQAVENFTTYNRQLAELLKKDELTDKDMGDIHQITYTLENALAKINEEMAALTDTLETVHIASEDMDRETLKSQARAYLSTAQQVVGE